MFISSNTTNVGHFTQAITHQIEYAQSLIDNLSVKERAPHIAVSVDMLDTGIDVPEVVNLVFFKIVRSKSKFWQMIGRGTRLCPDLYGPGQHKQDFYIFDFCLNFEYFNHNPAPVEGRLGESLTERLFKAQLELIYRLDERIGKSTEPETDGTKSEAGLRWDFAHQLHRLVTGINLENFVVRPKRRTVEYYLDFSRWHRLTPEAVDEIGRELAGLPSAVKDDDEEAKRFDLIALRLQLGQLTAEPGYERLRAQVQEIASALLEQTSIPVIREQEKLLHDIAADGWWQDITLPMLELMRRRVRTLVKLIERTKRAIVYTDFEDQLGEHVEVHIPAARLGNDYERFQARARVYLREHEDHLALQKLRRNKQLSPTDLAELERMLAESGVGATEDIERARQSADGLGLFIRSLVGLDRQAATEAFDDFLNDGRRLGRSQIDFIKMVISHLTQNGIMDPTLLYESPFTEIAPQGPDVLFPSADVDRIFSILHSVRATAAPISEVA